MNPAAEARAKAQQRWPGATVHERGRKFVRHQHPGDPARFMLDVEIGPMHYGPQQDQEIDTAWQPTTGAWDWEMTTNDFQTYARSVFNVGNLFQFERDGETLAFDPQSINWIDENTSRQQIAIKQAVAAQVNDDTLEFPGAYGPGIDFHYQNGTGKLSKIITIDQFSRIDTTLPAGNTIWFEAEFSMALSAGIQFWIDGAQWDRNTRIASANRIEIRDAATGTQTLWWLGLPIAYDANGDTVVGEMEVRRQGAPTNLFITVRIPKTWIDAAVFPIHIDPTIDQDVAASGDDGYVYSGTSAFNNSTTTITWGYTTSSPQYIDSWLRFTSISGLSGATIDTAYLTGFVSSSSTSIAKLLSADDQESPTAPTTYAQYTGITRTTAGVAWTGVASNGEQQFTPELKTVIQELADSYDPTAIQIVSDDNGQSTASTATNAIRSYDFPETPHLHIEYTAGGSTYTLTADAAGAYSFTGATATITIDRAISGTAGAYTLTGQTTGLVKSGEVTAVLIADWLEVMVENADLASDQFIIALSNTAPGAETTPPTGDGAGVLGNVSEVAYTFVSGNRNITTSSSSQAGGTYNLVLADKVITAAGGSVGPFRYIYVYDDTVTAPADPLMCYYDYGTNLTLTAGDTLTIDFADTGHFKVVT